jgi:uncharacterized protein (TIGR04222 family)
MHSDLWRQVLAHDFDQPLTSFGFSTRLARENFWTRNFTARAIIEYKKFMYLAATSDMMVSPSPIIDRAWHEHLMFSKSYKIFCQLLGKDIQHVPSTHNRAEVDKFRAAKERTQKLYEATFGVQPEDIWKFESMYDSLNLPKAKINLRTFINYGLLAFPLALLVMYFMLKPVYVKINNPQFGIGYFIICMICLVKISLWNRRKFDDLMMTAHPSSFVFDLQPMELVYLMSGHLKNCILGRLHLLYLGGELKVEDGQTLRLKGSMQPGNLEEWEVRDAFDKVSYHGSYGAIMSALERAPIFTNISNCMNALRKFVIKSQSFGRIFYTNFIVFALLLLFGFTRLATGIIREKPIGMLLTFLVVLLAFSIWKLYRLPNKFVSTIIPNHYKSEIAAEQAKTGSWVWKYFMSGTTLITPALLRLDSARTTDRSGFSWVPFVSTCGSSDSSSILHAVRVAEARVADVGEIELVFFT